MNGDPQEPESPSAISSEEVAGPQTPADRRAFGKRLLFFLCVYAEIFALWGWTGNAFRVPWDYFQLLHYDWLRERFWESIGHLHSQPPMLNALLGGALKLEALTGAPAARWLLGLHFLLGAEIVVCFALLCERFLSGRRRSLACLAMLAFHPCLYMFLFHYFYTIHELAILAPMAVLVMRFFERRRLRDYAAVCGLAVLLAYTRSLFHFIACIALLAILARPAIREGAGPPGAARRFGLCLVVAITALVAWPMKNQALFGFFGYSSWQGLNLASNLEVRPRDMRADLWMPGRFAMIPALASPEKNETVLNWNRYPVIEISKERQAEAIEIIRKDPRQLARKLGWNCWNYARFSGRNPYDAFYGVDLDAPVWALPWMAAYERILLLDFRRANELRARDLSHAGPEGWKFSGFFILFPALVAFSIRAIAARWRSDPVRAKTASFMLGCALWVFAMTLLVDGAEANRMRFSTEPFLILLAFWILPERKAE